MIQKLAISMSDGLGNVNMIQRAYEATSNPDVSRGVSVTTTRYLTSTQPAIMVRAVCVGVPVVCTHPTAHVHTEYHVYSPACKVWAVAE